MKRANPKIVGVLRCSCGAVMEVRERSNGKKLLYTYCPNCKLDQRSGDQIQEQWRSTMLPPGTELPPVETASSESAPKALPNKTESAAIEGEWIPPEDLAPGAEPKQEETKFNGKMVAGGLGVLALFSALAFGLTRIIRGGA